MDWQVKHYPAFWGTKKLAFPHVPREHAKFARSMAVGNLVFLSGCVGQDTRTGGPPPERIDEQVRLALGSARDALDEAGSSMENIVKTFFLVTNLADYAEVRRTETEFYEANAPLLVQNPPAATLMVVPSLAAPDFKVEYEAIGVIDRNMPDWQVTYYPEFWAGKELAFPHVPRAHAKFARTQVVGNLVIVSGCQALDHDSVRVETHDFEQQTRIVLDKIRTGMEETGGGLNNVVKTNVFLKDANQIALYRDIERDYFKRHAENLADIPPASSALVVSELPRPEFLIEVEAIGVVDRDAPGWDTAFHRGSDHHASSVKAGRLVFLSGCDGADPGTGHPAADVGGQIIAALDKVRSAIEQAGGSLDNVVKTTMMLTSLDDYPVMRASELDYYQELAPGLVDCPPASTFMQLPVISTDNAKFQIDAIAVLPE